MPNKFPYEVRRFLEPYLLAGASFEVAWKEAMNAISPRETSWKFTVPASDGAEQDESPLVYFRSACRSEYLARQAELVTGENQDDLRAVKLQLFFDAPEAFARGVAV